MKNQKENGNGSSGRAVNSGDRRPDLADEAVVLLLVAGIMGGLFLMGAASFGDALEKAGVIKRAEAHEERAPVSPLRPAAPTPRPGL